MSEADVKALTNKTMDFLKTYAVPISGAVIGFFVLSSMIPLPSILMSLCQSIMPNIKPEHSESIALLFTTLIYGMIGLMLFSGGSVKKFFAFIAIGLGIKSLWQLVKNVSNPNFVTLFKGSTKVNETDFGV
jgi:hypothetical protein